MCCLKCWVIVSTNGSKKKMQCNALFFFFPSCLSRPSEKTLLCALCFVAQTEKASSKTC